MSKRLKIIKNQTEFLPHQKNKNKLNLFLAFILIMTCIVLYGNTYYNNYCLDDAAVITENTTTQKGFAGITEQFTNYNADGGMEKRLWRPLPLASYSIEIGIWGSNHPGYSHLVNILIYFLIIVLLFSFLSKHIFKEIWTAFFIALLFAFHPIHSEVVANIKSRDELFCLLFILSSIHLLFKHLETKKNAYLFLSLGLYFLSLLSKENSLTFLLGIPVTLYFFSKLTSKKILFFSLSFGVVAVFYFIIRNALYPFTSFESSDVIINNPFLNAVGTEAFFTKIFILLLYLKLLFFPYPLSYDYSYNQIPYVNASSPWVWVSLLIYGGILLYALFLFKRKSVLSYCIIMFFITFSLASNLIIQVSLTLGERLLFLPSLFFCIAIVYCVKEAVVYLNEKIHISKSALSLCLIIPVFILSSFEIINRNKDWKDTDTLNLADYTKAPNSLRINDGVANYLLNYSDRKNISIKSKDSALRAAATCYEKALTLFPEFDNALIGVGIAYEKLGDVNKAEYYWERLKIVNPNHPQLPACNKYLSNYYLTKGISFTVEKNYDSSLVFLKKATLYAIENDSTTLEAWFHLGGLYFTTGKYELAKEALSKVIAINPNYKTAGAGYQACDQMLNMKK